MDWTTIGAFLLSFLGNQANWNRLGLLLTGVGVSIKPEYWQAIMLTCMGGGAVMAYVMEEYKKFLERRAAAQPPQNQPEVRP